MMGSFLIKPERGEDFYVLWSSVADAPVAWGPRGHVQHYVQGDAPERFERADMHGSSLLTGDYGWADDAGQVLIIREVWPIEDATAEIQVCDLMAFLRLFDHEPNRAEALALLALIEDEDDVDG